MDEMTKEIEGTLFCAECLGNKSDYINASDGRRLCPECAALYYAACKKCRGLVPKEEMVDREGELLCLECYSKLEDGSEATRLSETELETLITDFIRLHAEEKRIKDQLDEIKDRLKRHAATEQRIANTVVLRSGEHSVKCGYSSRVGYNSEKLLAIETIMGASDFASLFEREIKFIPIKEILENFLAADSQKEVETRNAIRAAMEIKEVVTISPNFKSGSRKSQKS